jgi:hypothetical protein
MTAAPELETFADIPAEVSRRINRGERVALIVLDAFGLEFLARHDDHPLAEHLDVTPLRSQFPSTTTAHMATLHLGLPVEQHGLYEWNILEPSLGEIICPLRFNRAGSEREGALLGSLDPALLVPGDTFYEQLGAPSLVLQPRRIEDSVFTRAATRGSTVAGFGRLEEGLTVLADAFAGRDSPSYAMLYWDRIDRIGHENGPSSPEYDGEARAALGALWSARAKFDGVTVLITADHGQVDVSPARVDYLDDLWPELPSLLCYPRPAGSSRDAFLHVAGGEVENVIEGLGQRLGDRAQVTRARELFGALGPRLEARLGDVAILSAPGREVWMRSAAANEQWFLGQHGGLDPAETSTYLARLTN